MNLSNLTPVRIGSKYIAKVKRFPNDVYLTVSSDKSVHECGISLAKEVDTIQEIIDLGLCYILATKYN
jgi:hypothetical protein